MCSKNHDGGNPCPDAERGDLSAEIDPIKKSQAPPAVAIRVTSSKASARTSPVSGTRYQAMEISVSVLVRYPIA